MMPRGMFISRSGMRGTACLAALSVSGRTACHGHRTSRFIQRNIRSVAGLSIRGQCIHTRRVPCGCGVPHSSGAAVTVWPSAEEEQLYRNMLEPHERCAAIEERQCAQTHYFSAHDGALIKYTPSGSEHEGRLMERITPRADQLQHPRKNALHMKLRANALKPSEYISQVARAGALQVLEGSAAWKVAAPTTDPAGPGSSVPAMPE